MIQIDELQKAVKRAHDAMSTAWTAVHDAQEQMRSAGVPDLIVDHLEAARLACMTREDFPAVVDALDKLGDLARGRLGTDPNDRDSIVAALERMLGPIDTDARKAIEAVCRALGWRPDAVRDRTAAS